MNADLHFHPDYSQARHRFVGAAHARGVRVDTLILDAEGPNDAPLRIDIAWLGERDAHTALIVQSGVHGVEAFAGSAIQLQALAGTVVNPPGLALILVHVLNPFGMAWLRRANENNVDLNRNCLVQPDEYRGTDEGYHRLHRLLNPESPPSFDGFALRAGLHILRLGLGPVKQAVAQGQYDYPNGLFYGGAQLEQGPVMYRQWLEARLQTVERLLVLDIHTGLGRYARVTVFPEAPRDAAGVARLRRAFGGVLTAHHNDSPGYAIKGGVAGLYAQALPAIELQYLTVEFGTYPVLKVLQALRQENRWHCFGGGGVDHPAKRRLRQALCPRSSVWRRRVLEQGGGLIGAALDYLSADPPA